MLRRDGRGVVRVEDTFATDVDDLWSAIADVDRLRRWLVDVEGDLRLGGAVSVRFTSGWEGTGVVQECDPPHRLRVAMAEADESVDGAAGTEIVAVVRAVPGGAHLTIEDRGLPLDEIHFHGAGWRVHVEDLGVHLAGRTPEEWRPRWTALVPDFETVEVGDA
ncbi:SRPBCC domain-containing protein [Cellulomonas sp. HZM]|uniref:SRPBCC domain-containing protein n=1 Tax=Cellulomonas sp. HZM TaxID=1454010 RepID=UPI0005573CC8|nr:SRPBCC domain-containing protein [Cellulomonas sp. HZM]